MMDGTRASATALYIDSIKQGVTTIFDHHASYGEIPGTLHTIAEESKRLGLRSCLCYEVSDRDGEEMCIRDSSHAPPQSAWWRGSGRDHRSSSGYTWSGSGGRRWCRW